MGSATAPKGRRSASPIPSSPGQSGAHVSPIGAGKNVKSNLSIEEIKPVQAKSKEASNFDKENPVRISNAVQETPGSKRNLGAQQVDLRSKLISLLTENPKGMSIKVNRSRIGLFFTCVCC